MDLVDWSAGIVSEQVRRTLPDPEEQEVQLPFRDSFHTAPGYREVAVEYTCVPDSMYPWDPVVMREIQRFAPDAVPMWVRWVFRTPEEQENPHDVVFGRHALGRVVEHLSSDIDQFRCLMPDMPCQGLHFSKPNRIWFIHEGPRPEGKYADLPGDYLPFDGVLLRKAVEMSVGFRMTLEEYKEHLRDQIIGEWKRGRERRMKDIKDDLEQRNKDWHRYADPIFERISEVEAAEHARRLKGSTP